MKLRPLAVGLMVGALALTACGQEGSPGGGGAPVVDADRRRRCPARGSPTFDAMHASAGAWSSASRRTSPASASRTRPPASTPASTSRSPAWSPPSSASPPTRSTTRSSRRPPARTPSSAARSTTSSARTRSTTTASSASPSPGRTTWPGSHLLVRSDETAITSKDTLKGKKVCSVTGSTPIQRVKDQGLTEPENIVEFQTYTQCVDQLLDNQVDASPPTTPSSRASPPSSRTSSSSSVSRSPRALRHRPGQGRRRAPRTRSTTSCRPRTTDGTWKQIYDAHARQVRLAAARRRRRSTAY